ncbi:PTS system D-mannitol-specific IIA component, Fru family /PTS system D-mannitol-specific IIB component, Fru family /PTS system D-mannitol-specific IIC component, Fru family [Arthrobacter alpinus]|uniref:Mannitol-specific phosphotransferase enzyme IIA component n=1 Tax=Arthrobacter alpinus TaxID=656366 RepID=A0A1H5MU25_9MICC|nr:PTS mannitol transporter subunit IICBA [Arthrobacter alpinus]SEE92869.1 PTS system D-mannitol-specific IIA component, Fru family /PTS system D-mannitol-specific IIB component, Fru family /PTS system D-mannitol-specific IIC component, Fru family [Arthrobacter alpinus]
MATPTVAAPKGGVRVGVQKFGTFLSGMIMPNIGAFIAWGLITALFIPAGFLPNETLGAMVGPMITYLLPLLIGYTGGKMIHGVRGGVVGAVATMGVIVGTDIPMFIGAMIMGPLTAWVMKKLDKVWEGRIKPGFEMLIDNFSAGILAGIMAIVGLKAVGPLVIAFSNGAGNVVEFLVNHGLLPLTSIFIEPAKVLFLNNAINHGILTPLGTEQALANGKSMLFLLEANPGPGLGLLLAYSIFGRGLAKASAPGAAVIQFFGGIHEIFFPYILMKPAMILATIGGGMTGIFMLVLTNAGLVAPAAPGSIFAVFAMASKDSYFGLALSVVAAAAVSFLIGSFILKISPIPADSDGLGDATAKMEALKGKKSSVAFALAGDGTSGPIGTVVFACDAGMGSSAMGASVLRNMIKKAGFPDVKVTNSAISNLTDTYDVVVTHQDLAARATPVTASAVHVAVDNFMNSPRYEEIVELVRSRNSADGQATEPAVEEVEEVSAAGGGTILARESVILSGTATTRDDAIEEAGALLMARGAVDAVYVKAMHEREASVSTYMGNFLAIPHGTNEAKGNITSSAVSIIHYPNGIDWNGKPVKFVVGIAGVNNEHLAILSSIARVFTNKAQVARLEAATTVEEILDIFGKVNA